jgi:gamma-glutamyltranspeptidase
LSADTVAELEKRGHTLQSGGAQGVAQVIIYNGKEDVLEGGTDRRASDGGAVGVPGRAPTKQTSAQR